MGAVDMSGTETGAEDVATAAHDAGAAAESLDGKSLGNVTGQFNTLTSAAARTESGIKGVSSAVTALNGRTANVTVTTTYRTVGNVNQRFAGGTQSAPGGLALVGDEASPDGSPRPELVSQNGRAFLAGLNGPEIVSLVPGAQVWPYSKTKAMLNGARVSTSFPAYALGNLTSKAQADSGKGNSSYVNNLVTVTFKANGGSGAPGSMRVTKNKAFTLPSTKPTRSGYVFNGWRYGRGIYQPRASVTVSSDATFTADWAGVKSSSGSGASGTAYTTTTTTTSGGGSYGGGGGGTSGGSSGGGSTRSPLDEIMDELKEKLKDIEFRIWLGQKTGDMGDAEIAASYQEAMALVTTYIQKYRDKGEDDNSDYIQELTKQWWEYADEITELQDGLVDEMKDAMEAQLGELSRLKKERVDALRAEADAEDDLLAIEEKRQALENARRERTVRIYNAATGQWEWVANAADVQAAQKAYDEERRTQDRAAQIKALEDGYDALEGQYKALLQLLETDPRTTAAILADARAIGTEKNAGVIEQADALSGVIARAILDYGQLGTVGGVMYGASPYAGGGIVRASATGAGAGDVNYYFNGVQLSQAQAETMTVASLARTLGALAVFNNT
jgi:uncharacterized repeat protein (TIGR02543 family)